MAFPVKKKSPAKKSAPPAKGKGKSLPPWMKPKGGKGGGGMKDC